MKNIVFIPILLILFTSCRKSKTTNLDCNDANTLFAPQLAKDLYAFKPGTWWVYEDLINHSFDSVWVGENTSVKQTMTTDDGNCSRCVEINTTKLYNKKYNLQATDSKYRTSYVDVVMSPLYLTQFSNQNSVNYKVDIETIIGEKYPSGKTQFVGNTISLPTNTNIDKGYIDSNYQYKKGLFGLAFIGQRKLQDTIYSESILINHIGLFEFKPPNDHTNMMLRRYNIVQ